MFVLQLDKENTASFIEVTYNYIVNNSDYVISTSHETKNDMIPLIDTIIKFYEHHNRQDYEKCAEMKKIKDEIILANSQQQSSQHRNQG